MSMSLRAKIRGKRKPCTKNELPAEQHGTCRKNLQAQNCRQSYVLYFCWSKDNASAHFEKIRGARIRSRFRSINVHAEPQRFKLRWTGDFSKIQKPHCGGHGQWSSANKRGSTSFRSRFWSLRDSAITRRNACCSIAWKTLRRPLISNEWVSGHKPRFTKEGKTFFAKRTILFRLLFPGYPPILVAFHLQHQLCRNCLQQLQPKSEVTDKLQETGPDHAQKNKTKITRGMAVEMRTTVCEIFLNGWRSSQIIHRTQKCLHPHTFLRTQIRNVPRKCYQNPRKCSIFHFPKDRNCEVCLRTKKKQGLLAEDALAKQYLEQKSFVTWWQLITKFSVEGCESRNNHRFAGCETRNRSPQRGGWIKKQSPIRCRVSGSCHSMDAILSVQKKGFKGDGKEFTNVPRAVTQAKIYWCRQFIGLEQILWRSVLESWNFNNSSIQDKWHCWKSRTKSERRNFKQYCYNQDWMKDGGLISWNAVAVFELSKTWGRQGDSEWKMIWRTIQRANDSQWSNGWISSDFCEGFMKNSSIWQENISWYLPWLWVDRGVGFGKEMFWLRIWKIWKSWTHQKFILEESTRKKYWQKGDDFKIPAADGTAKMSERDYEFREPTQRREPTVRSEDFSSELQGETGESQPTESKDVAEARADFWSIHGDFIHRHNEPPVQLYVPREETQGLLILISTCCKKNVLMTIGMSLRVDICQIHGKDSQRSLQWRRNLPEDNRGPGGDWQKFKRLRDRSCMAWSMDQNKESRSESRKTIMEKQEGKTRQCTTTEKNLLWWSGWPRIQGKPLNTRGENRKGPWTQPCRAKRRFTPATGNWLRRWLHLTKFQKPSMVVKWNPTNPQGNEWNLLYEDHTASNKLLRWC